VLDRGNNVLFVDAGPWSLERLDCGYSQACDKVRRHRKIT
jgi:hypothetical protein